FETRSVAFEHVPVDRVCQQIARDVGAVETVRKRATLVDDSAAGDVAAFEPGVGNVIEVTERIRIMQGPVFAETLDIISALHLVQPDLLAEIGPGDDVPMFVEVEAPGIAAAFREQLKLARDRVVTPDALVKLYAADICRYPAPLRAVKPSIRPPGQRVGKRMRVCQAEAAQQHFRVAVRNVVVVPVRIK